MNHPGTCRLAVLALALLLPLLPATGSAQQLITNGGFEAGLTGWVRADSLGSDGTYLATAGGTGPFSGEALLAPHGGIRYAVSDAGAPGAHTLFQTFVVSAPVTSATLSFWQYIHDASGLGPRGATHDYTWSSPSFNQHATVDLLSGDISASPFGGTVLANFFSGAGNTGWTFFTADVTALLSPGTYTLRFAGADNIAPFNHGIDDVSLTVNAVNTVPEPATVALVGVGILALAAVRRRRAFQPDAR